MRSITQLIHTLLALVLISCATAPSTQLSPTVIIPSTTTPTVDEPSDIIKELAANYTRWNDANIQDYRFSLTVSCFCQINVMMPITVEVRDGKVISIIDANELIVSTTEQSNNFFLDYVTITSIYTELTSSRFNEADNITITYDPAYAFPSTISVDFIEMAVDDELHLSVSGFMVVQEP